MLLSCTVVVDLEIIKVYRHEAVNEFKKCCPLKTERLLALY